MVAVRLCSPGVTKALLAANATVDRKDPRGWTPLMHAIDAHTPNHSREAVVIHLLDAGAAVDVWNDDLKGPFDLLAARKERCWEHKGHEEHGSPSSSIQGPSDPLLPLLPKSFSESAPCSPMQYAST